MDDDLEVIAETLGFAGYPGLKGKKIEVITPDTPFWIVSLDGGGTPATRHYSLKEARVEAERLCKKFHKRAHICANVGSVAPVDGVVWSGPGVKEEKA
jgi:hypothetical protein